MEVRNLHDKAELYRFLSLDPELHVYTIGDLDDFFWPKTQWFSFCDGKTVKALTLLYTGAIPPTLILLENGEKTYASALLTAIKPFLPARMMVHLSPGLIGSFGKESRLKDYGLHYRMVLTAAPKPPQERNIRKLSAEDIPIINNLLLIAYPENWFDQRMLETGMYFGYFIGQTLAGMAGVHVYSKEYKVAALGNITTHPEYRSKGIASGLTAMVCAELIKNGTTVIGLNVSANNNAAINCYEKAGFTIYGSFDECYVTNN